MCIYIIASAVFPWGSSPLTFVSSPVLGVWCSWQCIEIVVAKWHLMCNWACDGPGERAFSLLVCQTPERNAYCRILSYYVILPLQSTVCFWEYKVSRYTSLHTHIITSRMFLFIICSLADTPLKAATWQPKLGMGILTEQTFASSVEQLELHLTSLDFPISCSLFPHQIQPFRGVRLGRPLSSRG